MSEKPMVEDLWSHVLTCYGQRGAALGETPLPFAPRSIFEYISKKDQERIKNIAASRFVPPSTSDDPSPGPSLSTPPRITHTKSDVAQAALRGFQIFMADPSKQARYTAHLRAHTNPGSGAILPAQKPGQTPEEFSKETSDYTKLAALFRPVSGAMAGWFTTAAPEEEADMDVTEEKPKEEVKEEAPKVHAARLGTMYGAMTREVAGPEFTGTASADEFAGASVGITQVEGGSSGSSERDVANIGMEEAIFASNDGESDEEKDRMDDVDEVDEPPPSLSQSGRLNQARVSSHYQRMASWKMLTWLLIVVTATHQKHQDRDSEMPRKKKRKDEEEDGGENMWVEKPPPDIVKALPIDLSPHEGGHS
ncbi:hypothetical protein DFJ58DRAFT_912334 [Suillus subalutaceus]|uniref:uncharacterized protein n=1 Tax=Suillus subalutaceus TaxID=48586 RepID=UPI001B86DC08|nr:uncharacterized protein DFJ58DRAFT_912334 [Suillus subalutaceus]KAG1863563.1 hypothetical protein DFJ58DRAFT_912334 [Suillus subalutaceus]